MPEEQKKEKNEERKEEINREEINPEQKLRECEKLRDEYLAGWQRAKADFLNYKKEELERLIKQKDFAEEECLLKFLDVFENLKKAKEDPDKKGVERIFSQFKKILDDYGIKEIGEAGEDFNPMLHEAIETGEGENSGKIVEVLEKGYLINGRLLKPAKVKVVK